MTLSGTVETAAAVGGEIAETEALGGSLSAVSELLGSIAFSGRLGDSLVFSSHLEFPNIGDPRRLYVATDEAASYFFDSSQSTYVCCGSDCGSIDKIIIGLNEEDS